MNYSDYPVVFHNPSTSYAYAAAASPSDEEEDDLKPWERDGFIPTTASGKQKSPNQIRGELQRYIDSSDETQTAIMNRMDVNSNSFRKFMNPKTYKNQWSATSNGTYWAAARLLERVKYEKQQAKKTASKKRKAGDSIAVDGTTTAGMVSVASVPKKSKAELKMDAVDLMMNVRQLEGVNESDKIFDSCPEIVKKIKEFLTRDGVTKASFLQYALGGINSNSLNTFLAGKKDDQRANVTYRRAYVFFEKLRLHENKPKSAARKKNETNEPLGFETERKRTHVWVFGGM